MPFQIGALPEHFPGESALDVGRLCHGTFEHPALVEEMRANFEDLDALSVDAECKVDQGTQMRRRSPLPDEFRNQLLATPCFKFGERHD